MAESRNGDAKTGGGGKGGEGGGAGGGGGGGGVVQINLDGFSKRLKALVGSWGEFRDEVWGGVDAIAVVSPPSSEDLRYLKSSALHIWLLGYEFPETVMMFLPGFLHILCSQKKAGILEELRRASKKLTGMDVVLHSKARAEDGSVQMQAILDAVKVKTKSGSRNPSVGVLAKEQVEGALMERWADLLNGSGFNRVDVSNGFSEVFAVKDEVEVQNIKKASFLSWSVLKNYVVPKLEVVIDEEKSISHAELMESTEEVIMDPSKAKVRLKAENVDICYPPVFQSGGTFDLKPSAVSNDEPLYYDAMGVIICAIGARYNSYCSNIARTYLIDADGVQEKAYKVLLKAHEQAINALRPGRTMSAVYKAALGVVEKEAPEFLPQLTKNAGTGIGIEFRESGLTLSAKNERVLKSGMVFNIAIGFHGLEAQTSKHPKTRNFSLLLADTVVVMEKGPEIATGQCSKSFTDIAYSFKDDEEEPEEEKQPKVKVEANGAEAPPGARMATLRSDNQEMTKEEVRRQNQAELARQKNEETARRLASGGTGTGDGQGSTKGGGDMVAYKDVNDIPVSRELMIHVDQKKEAVLLPVYGLLVPFHIATVKSVTSQQDGGHCYIRIIFNVPGAGFGANDVPSQKFSRSIYVKEVSFRSSDVRHATQVVQLIKTMRRHVAQRESEKAERATLVTQEKLLLSKGRPIRLSDLWIRPAFGGRGRKMSGTLEAHSNGFRYSTMKQDERVDIMFRNIKHAFFQPAEKEMITLLHFHLHNFIMVGTKKTKDVQFFVEVMEGVQTLGGGNRRSMYDPDEIEEEQQERDRRNKINKEFEVFVKRIAELWDQPPWRDMEFDIPFRELGFHGVPNKSSAFIVPTVNCLVELVEAPFLVISLNDIEIVNLERVGLGQKAFDMAIVFKDFKRDVMRIDAIPSTSLDGIKEWLNSMNIKYYESRMNLNWRPILKTILDDPEKFIEDGGWEFLNMEGSDSDSEKSEESDEGYEPSDAEPVSESEDPDSDDDESVVESDDDVEEEEDSEEEEGLTWDELEAKAKREDKEKGDESDSEDERRRRKAKASGKARAPEMRKESRGNPRGVPNKRPKVRR